MLLVRLVMVVVAAGGVFGVAQHFLGNRGFALETRPNAGAATLFREALTGGVRLLAPGILAVAAAVALAATVAIGATEAKSPAGRSHRSPIKFGDELPPAGELRDPRYWDNSRNRPVRTSAAGADAQARQTHGGMHDRHIDAT